MSFDTTKLNRNRQNLSGKQSVWIFGYGSLIYKADFPWMERKPAMVDGWVRRFWQGSHDHRGTYQRPGRVVTLIEQPGAHCIGMAYRITPQTLAPLDAREKNGYLREEITMHFLEGDTATGLVYLATPTNAAWLGEASIEAIARQINQCAGPSGTNRRYALQLFEALQDLDAHDSHVEAVAHALLAMPTER